MENGYVILIIILCCYTAVHLDMDVINPLKKISLRRLKIISACDNEIETLSRFALRPDQKLFTLLLLLLILLSDFQIPRRTLHRESARAVFFILFYFYYHCASIREQQ